MNEPIDVATADIALHDAFNTATFKRLYGIIELNVRNGSHPDAANEIAPVRELTGPGGD